MDIVKAFREIGEASATQKERIDKILRFEEALAALPGSEVEKSEITPITNYYAPGIYIREVFLPKGTIVTGHIHLYDHIAIVVCGHILCADENGVREIKGYTVIPSAKRIKRVVTVLEDCIFLTIHPREDDEEDPDVLVRRYTVATYQEYEAHQGLLTHNPQEGPPCPL